MLIIILLLKKQFEHLWMKTRFYTSRNQFKVTLKIITCKYKDYFDIDIKNTNIIYKILHKTYFDSSTNIICAFNF